jgi:hypothetical protein
MHCTNCGAVLPAGATICPQCGRPVYQHPAAPVIPNYLVQSILVTMCCCMPAGIVAIVYAAQVNSKVAAGDIAGAQDASRKAKMWSWIGFGCGLLIALAYLVVGLTQGFEDL